MEPPPIPMPPTLARLHPIHMLAYIACGALAGWIAGGFGRTASMMFADAIFAFAIAQGFVIIINHYRLTRNFTRFFSEVERFVEHQKQQHTDAVELLRQDARQTVAMYQSMKTADLLMLRGAFTADQVAATLPESIVFGVGRIALIDRELARRGNA